MLRCSRDLAQKEGIFAGISAGGTFAGVLKVCTEVLKGATALCMLPDTGERYLSIPLFADIADEMSAEEILDREAGAGANTMDIRRTRWQNALRW